MMAWLSESVVAEDRPDHQIRRNRHIVQERPLPSMRWADIPELSTRDRRCPRAWQQYWQQSRRDGLDPRPSAFQAGRIVRSPCNVRVSVGAADRGPLSLAAGAAVTVAVRRGRELETAP
jgi:hypothetical protein